MSVNEFLRALKEKSKDDNLFLIQKLKESTSFIQEILNILENDHQSQAFNYVCEALFIVYNGQAEWHAACLQFVPSLIWAYFSLISRKDTVMLSQVEALLLAIYNKNVQKNKEIPNMNSYRVPTISKTSIFHEPINLSSTLTLTENALSQHEKANRPIFVKGSSKNLDHIPAGLRSIVLKEVLQEFNFHLTTYSRPILISLCNLVIRLSWCGYKDLINEFDYSHLQKDTINELSNYPKIRLQSNLIQTIVAGLRFTAFNSCYEEVKLALNCLRKHCQYSLSFAGVLVTNALQQLLELSANESDHDFDCYRPINPQQCAFRGKGKSSAMGAQRQIFCRTMSIDHNLSGDETLLTKSKSPESDRVSQPSVSIQIDTSFSENPSGTMIELKNNPGGSKLSESNTQISTVYNENSTFYCYNESVSPADEEQMSHEVERIANERTVGYMDSEEDDSDKTPLILNGSDEILKEDNSSGNSTDRDRCHSGSPLRNRKGSEDGIDKSISIDVEESKL